jgi:UDP-N-acetylglucosamine 1-carboxyvinyltransferase
MNFGALAKDHFVTDHIVPVAGAKNAILPLLLSTLLVDGVSTFKNAPTKLLDHHSVSDFIRSLGMCVNVEDDQVTVVNSGVLTNHTNFDLSQKSRYSILSAGCLAGRNGVAKVHTPGGCRFETCRPIDIHLAGLSALGCDITQENGGLLIRSTPHVASLPFVLPFQSVGATLNLVFYLIASGKGGSLLNCALEPEVCTVFQFLNACGAKISGIGTKTLEIAPSGELKGQEWFVISDRIEAGTYALFSVLHRKNITLGPVNKEHIQSLIKVFDEINVPTLFDGASSSISILSAEMGMSSPVEIVTGVYPGFPTDLQPLFVATALALPFPTRITETVTMGRFGFVSELRKLGADIIVSGDTAEINPKASLRPFLLTCPDIRGGMACIFGSSKVMDPCRVTNLEQVYRGYQDVAKKLSYFDIFLEESV